MSKLRIFLRRLGSDRSGAVAVVTALMLTSILGLAALGIETTRWYTTSRNVQAAADDAALSAAIAYAQGDTGGYTTEADSIAAANGFADGAGNVTVTVNMPPQSGHYAGNNAAVQVTITTQVKPLLAAAFIGNFNLTSTGVALINSASSISNGCVLALDPTASGAAALAGNASVTLSNCTLDVDSTSATGLTLVGNAALTASKVNLAGGDSISGNATLTAANGVAINQPAIADPYASRAIPSFAGCDHTDLSITSTPKSALQPGVYCGGLSIAGKAVVTLAAGTYILDRGDLAIHGQASVAGSDVTIILTSSGAASATGNVVINGGATVTLTAPSSGALSGLAIWHDGRAPDSASDKFNGGSSMAITGAIYTPSQSISYSGANSTGGTGCTQLVAYNISFTGGAEFDNSCSGIGVAAISGVTSLAQLAE